MSDIEPTVEWVSDAAVIQDPTGLHARPAVKLTRLAKTFEAAVEIRANHGNNWTNAKSPNKVMKLKAAHGEPLHVRAAGADAPAAVAALIDLLNRDFDD
ncbi:HPr family phosphocarrier protein [Pelagibius marinus]|uniref:HPr family phosphocarrier protein n=1 Tax=Pelagibius marinus TaxID=2762760 RepID=UPI0018725BAF|nr:HPr family phosphocarrier protein [Pelagibius marinus]